MLSPNFSPFPFDRLRKISRRAAAVESALARWCAVRAPGGKTAVLVGGAVQARIEGVVPDLPDPQAALAEVRIAGATLLVAGAARPVRALAQRLLGGPAELDAARPLTVIEHAIWALAVAAAVADLGIAAEVWPLAAPATPDPGAITVAFTVALPDGSAMTVTVSVPAAVTLRAPPPRIWPAWPLDLPIVVGRCLLARASLARLAVGDVITIESRLELVVGTGAIGLAASHGAVEARVVTEYVPRPVDMALADDATLEVTVQLGTARLSLRQLGELSIGQIVALGRPLAGPYEVRAAGRVVGQGELVDIDGELGVRIVSIADPGSPE